jgi:hypothetical protein
MKFEHDRGWLFCLVLTSLLLCASCGSSRPSENEVSKLENALLPSGWAATDVGSPGLVGSDGYAGGTGTFTVTGSGTGLTNWYQGNTNYYWNDQFHYVYKQVSGDFEIVVRATSVGAPLSQFGIAVREDLTPLARNETIFYSPASSFDSPPQDVVQATARTVANAQPSSLARVNGPYPTRPNPPASPVWLKIVRVGGDVGTYWSRDGSVWIPAATGGAFVPTGTVNVGMYVASNSESSAVSTTFDNVYVGPPRLQWKSSWVGNSFDQASSGPLSSFVDDSYVTTGLSSLWVAPDGSCWTNSGWDEDGQSQKIYKDDGAGHGKIVKTLTDNWHFGNNSSPSDGSITSDGTYTYVDLATSPPTVSRTDANGLFNSQISFSSSVGQIAGLGASGGNHELYVSDITNHKILVVDTTTSTELPLRAFDFTQHRPGPIAVDSRGDLWIIQEGTDFPMFHKPAATEATGIYCYTKGGVYTGRSITDVEFPTAVAIDPNQDQLLVADNGQNQNIRIYGSLSSTPTLTSTFGVSRGIYSGSTPGLINDPLAGGMARFYALTGVGKDAAGNLFVACDGRGTDLRKFDSAGNFVWSLNANEDSFGCGDFDPGTDGQDMFTHMLHYGLDYSQTLPGKEWSYRGFTFDPVKYPSDDRSLTSSTTFVRRFGGNRRFMFFSPGGGGEIEIFRFDGPSGTGETAIPAGRLSTIFNPNGVGTTKLWVDANGDGKDQPGTEETTIPCSFGANGGSGGARFDIDAAGGIWWLYGGIIHLTAQGVDGVTGVPQYSLSGAGYSTAPVPPPFAVWPAGPLSLQYDSDTDAMYIGGNTSTVSGSGISIGGVLSRYDNWTATQNNAMPRYQLVLPSEATASDFYQQGPPWAYNVHPFFKSFDVAGGYIFAWEEFGQVHVFDAALANPVINIGPGPEVDGIVKWTDSTQAHAFKRSTGEYELTMEDSGIKARNLLYRWTPAAETVPPAPPTVTTALSDNGVIHLTWNGPRGLLTKYRVYRSTTSGEETLYADNLLAPDYNDTNVEPGYRYFYQVTAVNAAGEGTKSNEASAIDLTPSATFILTDASTRGNWKGVYGASGYWILGDVNNLPSSAPASSNGILQGLAPGGTTDVRALQQPGTGTGRELFQMYKAAAFPATGYAPFDIDLNLTDGDYHQVAVYICDFNYYNYGQSVQVLSATSGAVLDTQTISAFSGGEYLIWTLTGHVKLRFLPQGGWNSSASAVFLDIGNPLA